MECNYICMSYDFQTISSGCQKCFLNWYIIEEVYVEQPLEFEDKIFPNHAYKLNKVLYELKQAPGSSYERLSKFLIEIWYGESWHHSLY